MGKFSNTESCIDSVSSLRFPTLSTEEVANLNSVPSFSGSITMSLMEPLTTGLILSAPPLPICIRQVLSSDINNFFYLENI